MADDDLDLNHEGSMSGEGFGVRKNIALKLKPSPKGKRGRKPKHKKEEVREEIRPILDEYGDEEIQLPILKFPLDPQHKNRKLNWDHKVHLIGTKNVDPLIHCCEHCALPILIYGRMIPCKHVFCLDCAKKAEKSCTRCNDPVQRIEQAALGTVFVCTNGGAKHGVSGCRRTYLSNRDLQAHIQYRHQRDHQPSQQQQQPQIQHTQVQQPPPVSHAQQMPPAAVQHPPPVATAATHYPPPQPLQTHPAVSMAAPIQQTSANTGPMYPPPNFSSPPPPVGAMTQAPGGAPPGVPSQGYHHQPPVSTVDSYNQAAMDQRNSTLISIPLQGEQGGGYHPHHPPHPGVGAPYMQQGGPGSRPPFQGGFPPPPQGQVMHPGHMGGPPPRGNNHGPPRGYSGGPPPGQNVPYSQAGGGPPRGPWQGPGGPGGHPMRGPPPGGPQQRGGPGPGAPNRY